MNIYIMRFLLVCEKKRTKHMDTYGQNQFGLKIFIYALLVKFEEHLDARHMTWRIPRQEPLSTSEAERVRIELVGLFDHWNLLQNWNTNRKTMKFWKSQRNLRVHGPSTLMSWKS